MAKDKTILAKLDMDTTALVKSAIETKKEIEKLQEQQDKLISKGKETSAQFITNSAALKNLETAYKSQQQALAAQTAEDGKLLTVKKAVKQAVQEVNDSENDYLANNRELIALKKQLNSNDDDYEKRLAKINSKLQENNNWLQENGSAHARLITTMSDYKQQVTDSFNSINILNGGLSGLVSRAQEAGGAGPLLKGALDGMSQGIVGMTKSAMSFILTPFGAVLAALALIFVAVQNSMDRGTESAGKITKIFNTFSVITDRLMGLLEPLGDFLIDGIALGFEMAGKAADAALGFISDGLAFLGFEDAAEGVTNFTEDIKKTAAETTNLKNAQEKLAAQMAVQEVANETAKQQIDALIKKSEDQTASEEDRLDALSKAAVIEKNNFTERQKLADDAYNQAVRKAAMNKGLTAEELAELQIGGAAYAEKMMKVKGFTQQEIDALQKAQTERLRLTGQETQMVQDQAAAEQKIRDDAAAKREAAADRRQKAEDARRQKAKQAMQDAIALQKIELDLFIEQQGTKALSLKEELDLAQKVASQKKAIAQAEFEAAGKTALAKKQLELENSRISNDLLQKNAALAVDNADRVLQAYVKNHQSQIEQGQFLSDDLYLQEVTRLNGIAEAEKNFQAERLANKVISEQQYNDELAKIDEANNATKDALKIERDEADKAKQATDLANKRAADVENHDYDLQYQLDNINALRAQELEEANKTGADKSLIEAKYNKLEVETKKAVMDNKLSLANSTFGSMATLLGKESAAGKAMAVAQATIDTYKSAVSAYSSMSGIPVVGPALGAVAAAAAVAAGVANVKKITSTKAPKAAKGALFNIGGNRHSNGGTMFTGADGTRFEAEQGELIGVMNRNAAAHFMAFNNAFPAGGSSGTPNYFASGGIVSREMASPGLNVDELAAKIAVANAAIPAPVVAVQDIITQGNSYVQVRDAANF